jgi:SNF2 family DNA or RNA helicase
MDDEQSAGLNLTNLNHAIFVHPLFANNQQEYDAHETQAIGRIRRFGQIKKVHVWRFLARNTIDTKIFDERSSHMISATTSNSDHNSQE